MGVVRFGLCHILQSAQCFVGKPHQESITTVQTGGDECMDGGLSNRVSDG